MSGVRAYQILGMHSGMTIAVYHARSWREALEQWAKARGYATYAEFASATHIVKTEFDGVHVKVW